MALSTDITIQQRVLRHTGMMSYCLRLLERLPADTVLVRGYSDGHTSIGQVTLDDLQALLASSIEQLEGEAQHWQQPAIEGHP